MVATAGRDGDRLSAVARGLGTEPLQLELRDPDSCRRAITSAAEMLGRLDGLVVATGAVAFGRSGELDPEAEGELIEINARGPIRLVAEALPRLEPGGAVVALSAVVAEFPTAGMAACSASTAALSAYLEALRREWRRDLEVVLDIRPGHMDTGFADRALAGVAPRLPEPQSEDELVEAILAAVEADARELAYDPRTRKTSQG